MKAIRLHEPTGIDGLVFEEVPDGHARCSATC